MAHSIFHFNDQHLPPLLLDPPPAPGFGSVEAAQRLCCQHCKAWAKSAVGIPVAAHCCMQRWMVRAYKATELNIRALPLRLQKQLALVQMKSPAGQAAPVPRSYSGTQGEWWSIGRCAQFSGSHVTPGMLSTTCML
jgi:hypothetical protein